MYQVYAEVTQGERSLGVLSASLTEITDGRNAIYRLEFGSRPGDFVVTTHDDSVFKALSRGRSCKVEASYEDAFNDGTFPVTLTSGPGYKLLMKRQGLNANDDKMVLKLDDRFDARTLVSPIIGWDHKIHAIEDHDEEDDSILVRLDSGGGETMFVPSEIIKACALSPGMKINLMDFRDRDDSFTGITAYHDDGKVIEELWQD